MVSNMARGMKDSGVEWIGEIPKEWNQISLRKVLREPITDGPHETPQYVDDGIPFISVDSIGKSDNVNLNVVKKYISTEDYEEYNKKTKLSDGDILFTKSASIGKTAIVDTSIKYMVWSPLAVIKPNYDLVDNKFLYYQFNSDKYIEHVTLLGTSNTQVNVGMKTLQKSKIVFPDVVTQKSIVSFLDVKISQIDSIIDKTKETVEEYKAYKQSLITEVVTKGLDKNVKMKDSGIEWIGEIPDHWGVIKGKYTLSLLKRNIEEYDGVVTCFRDGEVTLRSNRREDGFTMADKEIGYQGVEQGDLVIHGMDGFAGAIGISDSKGKSSPVLNVCDSKQNKKYLMYYLRSMAYNDVFLATATGIRIRSCDLRWKKIADLSFPTPSINEQNEIVNFIDDKLKQVDEVLSQKSKLLQELETYKKSLIYEVVTGKKEV